MRPRHDSPPVRPDDTPEAGQWSLQDMLETEFRRFLKVAFDNNTALIAYTFEVSHETARLWITTSRLPRAEILYRMICGYPAFAQRLRLVVDNPAPQPPKARDLARAQTRRVA